MMNRRRFLSTTAAATAGLAAGLPTRSYAQKSANETINVAIIGIRGDNEGHPTWTARGRGQDHYEHLSRDPERPDQPCCRHRRTAFHRSVPFMKEKWGGDPRTEVDFRRVLENRTSMP